MITLAARKLIRPQKFSKASRSPLLGRRGQPAQPIQRLTNRLPREYGSWGELVAVWGHICPNEQVVTFRTTDLLGGEIHTTISLDYARQQAMKLPTEPKTS